MGFFRVRKSIRICPGVKLNIGKKGITSLSIGKAGATVNLSSKGVKGFRERAFPTQASWAELHLDGAHLAMPAYPAKAIRARL